MASRSILVSILIFPLLFGTFVSLATEKTQTSCKSVVISGDPEFPPFAWYDGKELRGASVDVVIAALNKINLHYEVRYVGPFLRLLKAAEEGHVDIITELKNTPEREAFLRFSSTPIFTNPTAVFVRANNSQPFKGRDDLKGRNVGVTLGTKFGDTLDEFVAANLKVDVGPGIRENFMKLDRGRIDFFISPYYPAISYLASAQKESDFIALQPYIANVKNYVGWSKRSPCINRLPEFELALAQVVAQGYAKQKVAEYVKLWKTQTLKVQTDILASNSSVAH